MRKLSLHCLSLIMIISLYFNAYSQEKPKFSGYMFGDYYYVMKNHDGDLKGANGFRFRRIYFTFDRKISSEFKVRLRFEMASAGDFTTSGSLSAKAKDAYLEYAKGNNSIIFGISPTPTFGLIENVWGYRSVEKAPVDLYKLGPSRDFGLAFKGSFDPDNKFQYHIMFGNGSSSKPEVKKGKKLMTALSYHFNSGLVIEGYFDVEDKAQGKRRTTLQGFLGYKGQTFRSGFQYTVQSRRIGPNTDDQKMKLVSIFGANKISEKVWIYFRFDKNYDPDPDEKISYILISKKAKSNLIIAGFDFNAGKDVHIIPNIEAVFYQENESGYKPGSDLIPRLTFYYKF
ncbi:porin [candidate division KSB1 bacterium]